jgi:cobalamin transport system substrate-binding protein
MLPDVRQHHVGPPTIPTHSPLPPLPGQGEGVGGEDRRADPTLRVRRAVLIALSVLVVAACGIPAARDAPPPLGASRSPRQATIVEPRAAPGAFPRTVRDMHGTVVIPTRPVRIHTLSVGYDEITFRLVDPARIAGVGSVTASPEFSNVAAEAQRIPTKVGRDAEQILALNPDLVVASPFANADLLKQLRDARVTLVVADLVSSIDAQADNIRLLAYLYGEEARGEDLVREVSERIARLEAVADRHPRDQRPRVLLMNGGQTISVAGLGTTEDGVLDLAGARNVAAEAGITGNLVISLEALPEMQPDLIVVTEGNPDRPVLLPRLVDHPVVGALPALREHRVLVMKASLITTLSHWNVAGAEQLNRALYPGELP